MKKTGGNGGYRHKKDHGRPPNMGDNPRTPKPGKQPERITKKRAQDGTRSNAKS